MHIHPAIAALRSERASQRSQQARMNTVADQWRTSKPVQAVQRDLAAYGAGDPLDRCPALAALVSDHAAGLAFAQKWIRLFAAELRQSPLGEVPFQHRHSGGYSTVQLLSVGAASLNLSAYERRATVVEPQTAVFADRQTVELVIGGEVRGICHQLIDQQRVASETVVWRTGDRIETSSTHSRQFVEVATSFLVLQLSRSPERPGPTREYHLADSALLKSASGDKQASRDMLALGVLGALDHQPSLDAMAAVARDRTREPDLRWEAVRQSLALDPVKGIALLDLFATQYCDPLSVPAKNLAQQLRAAHPQLEAA